MRKIFSECSCNILGGSPYLQVTVNYKEENGAMIPVRVHTVVISVQHDDVISLEEQKRILKEKVIKAVVPAKYLDDKTIYHLQPSGRFVIGGPQVGFFMTHSCFFLHAYIHTSVKTLMAMG